MRSAVSLVQQSVGGPDLTIRPAQSKAFARAVRLSAAALCLFLGIGTGVAAELLARLIDILKRQFTEGREIIDPVGAAAVVCAILAAGSSWPRIGRGVAICAKAFFLAYALRAQIPLILALHSLLLPINIVHWHRERVGRNSSKGAWGP